MEGLLLGEGRSPDGLGLGLSLICVTLWSSEISCKLVDVGIFSPGNAPTKYLPATTKEVYICLQKAPPYSGPAGTSYNAQEHSKLAFFLTPLSNRTYPADL